MIRVEPYGSVSDKIESMYGKYFMRENKFISSAALGSDCLR